ncbi:MAG: tRNA 2-thiouridine(34) synthase MnmA [Treponema sp.]
MEFIDERLPEKGETVAVGMSGGVDSTLTALLMKQRGCRVIGVTMSLWDGLLPELKEGQTLRAACYGPSELTNIEECRAFCAEHGIEYRVVDVKAQYRAEVLEYFKREYRAGRTPNPCVRCNATVKFGALLDGLSALGVDFDFFCTGHYSRIVRPVSGLWNSDKRPCMIAGAADASKDQTYFLYRIPSSVLEKVRFPLAKVEKSEVFDLARKFNLAAAARKESQDFIAEQYYDLIFSDAPSVPGDIIDLDGNVLGRHRGIEHYTVGQRRGLGVSSPRPLYVHSLDAARNLVMLAENDDLNARSLIADNFVWPADVAPKEAFRAHVKIRLATKPVACLAEPYMPSGADGGAGSAYRITFDSPQRAVAPGQSAVLYKDGVIVGGGVIRNAE